MRGWFVLTSKTKAISGRGQKTDRVRLAGCKLSFLFLGKYVGMEVSIGQTHRSCLSSSKMKDSKPFMHNLTNLFSTL